MHPTSGPSSPSHSHKARLVVCLTVVVLVLEEEVLVCAVTGESDASDTEAREDTLETVEAAEGTGVSPCFTAGRVSKWSIGQ